MEESKLLEMLDTRALASHLTLGSQYRCPYVCECLFWIYSPSAKTYYETLREEQGAQVANRVLSQLCTRVLAIEPPVLDPIVSNEIKFFELCSIGEYNEACELFQSVPVFGALNTRGNNDLVSTSTLAVLAGRNWFTLLLLCLRRARFAGFEFSSSDVLVWQNACATPSIGWFVYITLWPEATFRFIDSPLYVSFANPTMISLADKVCSRLERAASDADWVDSDYLAGGFLGEAANSHNPPTSAELRCLAVPRSGTVGGLEGRLEGRQPATHRSTEWNPQTRQSEWITKCNNWNLRELQVARHFTKRYFYP